MDRDFKRQEEAKRERCWDPVERWRVLLETIAWADQQSPVPRNSPQACMAKEARILKSMSELASSHGPTN